MTAATNNITPATVKGQVSKRIKGKKAIPSKEHKNIAKPITRLTAEKLQLKSSSFD